MCRAIQKHPKFPLNPFYHPPSQALGRLFTYVDNIGEKSESPTLHSYTPYLHNLTTLYLSVFTFLFPFIPIVIGSLFG